jgi:pilus assembly protein CpaB
MKSTGQKLILISFVLAVFAAVVVFMYLQSLKTPKQEARKTTILVANETIPARTLISNKMIKKIQIEYNSIFEGYVKDSSKIVGKYTNETILKDEGFHIDNFLDKDNSNELSFKINSNYRAISISVTGDSGVSDLIKPGDYVDVIAYVSEKKDGSKVIRPDIAKIILQNIELLAVDKTINRDEKTDANGVDVKDAEKLLTNFLVTLSVQKADVEKLVLAESIGSIKLVLRPLKDKDTTQTNGTTWDNLSANVSSGDEQKVQSPVKPKKENNASNTGSKPDVNNLNSKNKVSKVSGKTGNYERYTSYTVKRKDTLRKISKKFYGDESKYTIIKQANNIKNEDMIVNKQVIKIPTLQQ